MNTPNSSYNSGISAPNELSAETKSPSIHELIRNNPAIIPLEKTKDALNDGKDNVFALEDEIINAQQEASRWAFSPDECKKITHQKLENNVKFYSPESTPFAITVENDNVSDNDSLISQKVEMSENYLQDFNIYKTKADQYTRFYKIGTILEEARRRDSEIKANGKYLTVINQKSSEPTDFTEAA